MIEDDSFLVTTARICPYCKKEPVLVDSKEIYGKSYGNMYLCRDCDAYVGCHKGTEVPLGRLADRELRSAKKEAHKHFDEIWRDGGISRADAYKWLSEQLGISEAETHIGMFNVETCKKVVELSKQRNYDEDLS